MSTLLSLTLAAAVAWLDPASVQPHQKGVCVTEWTGGERWEIPVEIMGTLDAPGPGRTAVLVRLDDPRFADGGVAQGMSGSPVYIDGKLLGAVAFGWPFARQPLAGVTPFAAMRTITPGGQTALTPGPGLTDLAAIAARRADPFSALPRLDRVGGRVPLLLGVSGLPTPSDHRNDPFARIGLSAVPAAGRVSLGGVPQPGEMVAAELIWGDALVAAAGTITARDGDTLWAFGHPFLSLGAVDIPAARARVLAVQTSYDTPFKVFAVGDTFGAFVADRSAGMLIKAAPGPKGLPVSVTVREAGDAHTWRFRAASVPLLEPLLVTYLANACLTARGAASGLATVRMRIVLRLADGREATLDQATQGSDALARMAGLAGTAVGFLANSDFPHPPLASIDIDLDRDEQARGAVVVEAVPDRNTIAPGEKLGIRARLDPVGEPPREVRLELQVPTTLQEGRVDLIVADGAAWSDYEIKAAGIDPASLDDQLTQLGMLETSRHLVAVLETREGGLAGAGLSEPGLPPSWAATIATGLGTNGGLTRLQTTIVAATRWSAPYPLVGAFRIPLTVKERNPEVP
jgi:SpoIVB peptidase S55